MPEDVSQKKCSLIHSVGHFIDGLLEIGADIGALRIVAIFIGSDTEDDRWKRNIAFERDCISTR